MKNRSGRARADQRVAGMSLSTRPILLVAGLLLFTNAGLWNDAFFTAAAISMWLILPQQFRRPMCELLFFDARGVGERERGIHSPVAARAVEGWVHFHIDLFTVGAETRFWNSGPHSELEFRKATRVPRSRFQLCYVL
jgi:hypothetical protein